MISESIKEHTKTAHADLEKTVVKKLKEIRSDADYAGLLKSFYSYFDKLEAVINQYIDERVLPDHSARRKADKLKMDIEELGATTVALPLVTQPLITNAQQAMGALYVMEGSVLGGTIIVQMLAKAGITKGISFFSGYKEQNGDMWGKFVTALNNAGQTEEEKHQIMQTAADTFAHFKSAF